MVAVGRWILWGMGVGLVACAATGGSPTLLSSGEGSEREANLFAKEALREESFVEIADPTEGPATSASASGTPGTSATVVDTKVRIGSVRRTAWIFDRPTKKGRQIGYIREGTAAALASNEPVPGTGCRSWYGLEPAGYVCLDHTTTLDLKSPRFQALAEAAPSKEATLPYRYVFSKGAPMYNRIPTPAEQLKVEGPRERWVAPPKLSQFLSGHEELAVNEEIKATDKVPEGWKEGAPSGAPKQLLRKWIPHGSMLAYHAAFEAHGRVWLLSPDMTVVPADRVKPFRVSTFRGLVLSAEIRLPIAWSRHDPVRRYQKKGDEIVVMKESLPPRTSVMITGDRVEQGGRVFLATREPDLYLLENDVVVASTRSKEKMPANIEENQRWIDVHIRSGTLTAYIGERPVFTTLASPGAGGYGSASASNAELVKQSATPLGVYRVTWKTRAAVMSPENEDPKKFWIADVPHTLYFRPPFAIHTAYWHEDFGMPKSAGCVNVSPEDGRFLYDWADPPTPSDWQGSGPGKGMGVGTLIVIAP